MSDPLALMRSSIQDRTDAVRWACILEATSPKAGNVYPGQSFPDLAFRQFIDAAEIAADAFGESAQRFSVRIDSAVRRTVAACKTNVNLGIALLLGPLVAADERLALDVSSAGCGQWLAAVRAVLSELDGDDGTSIFGAIAAAAPGGLGQVDRWDVNRPQQQPIDVLAAMRDAAQRDRIALQYACGFQDLFEQVVPVLEAEIAQHGDLLTGIAMAQLRLLAAAPDSLIARKHGLDTAAQVQRAAQDLDSKDPTSVAQLDAFLRRPGPRLNPGTTADLIAAGLYVLLRSEWRLETGRAIH